MATMPKIVALMDRAVAFLTGSATFIAGFLLLLHRLASDLCFFDLRILHAECQLDRELERDLGGA